MKAFLSLDVPVHGDVFRIAFGTLLRDIGHAVNQLASGQQPASLPQNLEHLQTQIPQRLGVQQLPHENSAVLGETPPQLEHVVQGVV
jgi:hypothetical protein